MWGILSVFLTVLILVLSLRFYWLHFSPPLSGSVKGSWHELKALNGKSSVSVMKNSNTFKPSSNGTPQKLLL